MIGTKRFFSLKDNILHFEPLFEGVLQSPIVKAPRHDAELPALAENVGRLRRQLPRLHDDPLLHRVVVHHL